MFFVAAATSFHSDDVPPSEGSSDRLHKSPFSLFRIAAATGDGVDEAITMTDDVFEADAATSDVAERLLESTVIAAGDTTAGDEANPVLWVSGSSSGSTSVSFAARNKLDDSARVDERRRSHRCEDQTADVAFLDAELCIP